MTPLQGHLSTCAPQAHAKMTHMPRKRMSGRVVVGQHAVICDQLLSVFNPVNLIPNEVPVAPVWSPAGNFPHHDSCLEIVHGVKH